MPHLAYAATFASVVHEHTYDDAFQSTTILTPFIISLVLVLTNESHSEWTTNKLV